jgi:hypothetical protein
MRRIASCCQHHCANKHLRAISARRCAIKRHTQLSALHVQPDELASGRETSSSQNDLEDEDNISVVGSARSVPLPSECDGDFFYDALEPQRPRTSRSLDASERKPGVPGAAEAAAALPAPSWAAAEPDVQRRLALPPPKETQKSISLWSIIKECIGKDLTRICLPVYFNEPLSVLQKMAEEFEYADLLERAAAAKKGSPHRLMWLAVFAVSGCVLLRAAHAHAPGHAQCALACSRAARAQRSRPAPPIHHAGMRARAGARASRSTRCSARHLSSWTSSASSGFSQRRLCTTRQCWLPTVRALAGHSRLTLKSRASSGAAALSSSPLARSRCCLLAAIAAPHVSPLHL